MRRYKLHNALLNAIKDGYMDSPLTGAEQMIFDLAEASESIPDMCDCLLNASGFRQTFKLLVQKIKDAIQWADVIVKNASIIGTGLKVGVDVSFKKLSYKRNFAIFEQALTCFNSERMYDDTSFDEETISAIEKICVTKKNRNAFLAMIDRNAIDTFCIIYDPNTLVPGAVELDMHRLYSYGLLWYLNKKKIIPVPSSLAGRMPIEFSTTLSYVDALVYEQYFDIYDVMNEWQHSTDYLTSFLKMYQVMEFMAYRCLLSDLVDNNDIRHSFLRSVKNLDNKYNKSERDTFISQLSLIFNNFASCAASVSSTVEDFVEKHLSHDSDNPKRYLQRTDSIDALKFAKRILKFIYDVRCSIVHNKESELHFTFNTVNEYQCLLPLMKQIEDTEPIGLYAHLVPFVIMK